MSSHKLKLNYGVLYCFSACVYSQWNWRLVTSPQCPQEWIASYFGAALLEFSLLIKVAKLWMSNLKSSSHRGVFILSFCPLDKRNLLEILAHNNLKMILQSKTCQYFCCMFQISAGLFSLSLLALISVVWWAGLWYLALKLATSP